MVAGHSRQSCELLLYKALEHLPIVHVNIYVCKHDAHRSFKSIQTCHTLQGRTQNLMWVGSFQEKVDLFDGAGVQSTPSMRSMLKLGGLGACPPGKFEK